MPWAELCLLHLIVSDSSVQTLHWPPCKTCTWLQWFWIKTYTCSRPKNLQGSICKTPYSTSAFLNEWESKKSDAIFLHLEVVIIVSNTMHYVYEHGSSASQGVGENHDHRLPGSRRNNQQHHMSCCPVPVLVGLPSIPRPSVFGSGIQLLMRNQKNDENQISSLARFSSSSIL